MCIKYTRGSIDVSIFTPPTSYNSDIYISPYSYYLQDTHLFFSAEISIINALTKLSKRCPTHGWPSPWTYRVNGLHAVSDKRFNGRRLQHGPRRRHAFFLHDASDRHCRVKTNLDRDEAEGCAQTERPTLIHLTRISKAGRITCHQHE